jgi:hypothetical protein
MRKMETAAHIEYKAKKLAARFNSLNIPTLSYGKMQQYLRENGITSVYVLSPKFRHKIFDEKTESGKGGEKIILTRKKTPVHYSFFVEIYNYTWKSKRLSNASRQNAVTDKDMREAVDKLNGLPDPTCKTKQRFFGEHLLAGNNKPVAIVESEKTAIVASCYLPECVWLACGGSEGLNPAKCECLKGRTVLLYPDVGMYDYWCKKAEQLRAICLSVVVSDLIEKNATDEERKAKYDVADYLIRADMPNNVLTVEKCISFLKENGYTGKIEKVIKTEFEI